MAIYNQALKSGRLEIIVEKIKEIETKCNFCPLNCGVNRTIDLGRCKTGVKVPVAEYLVHLGEEAPIVGQNGTGAIFLSNCNLNCVFCQNSEVSQDGYGSLYDERQIADIMLELQSQGCHNIDWVSPTHCVNILVKSLFLAAQDGLNIPIVYNTNGYENINTLGLLDGLIDIYMPDIKWSNNSIGLKFSNVENYTEINRQAIQEMHRQVGDLILDEDGVVISGVLLRYLILPNNIDDYRQTCQWILENLGKDTYISLLTEYYPCYKACDFPELSRQVVKEEIDQVIRCYEKHGFNRLEYY